MLYIKKCSQIWLYIKKVQPKPNLAERKSGFFFYIQQNMAALFYVQRDLAVHKKVQPYFAEYKKKSQICVQPDLALAALFLCTAKSGCTFLCTAFNR